MRARGGDRPWSRDHLGHRVDHARDVLVGHARIERQGDRPVADAFRDREIAGQKSESLAVIREEVHRAIVHRDADPDVLQLPQTLVAPFGCDPDREQVTRARRAARNLREIHARHRSKRLFVP